MSILLRTRNVTADIINMFEVLTDMFPGIEGCIDKNLVVKDECTVEGQTSFIKRKATTIQTDNLDWEKKIIPSIYANIGTKVNETGNTTRHQMGDLISLMKRGNVLKNLKIRPEYKHTYL